MDPDQNASVCFFWYRYDRVGRGRRGRAKEGEHGSVKIRRIRLGLRSRLEEQREREGGRREGDGSTVESSCYGCEIRRGGRRMEEEEMAEIERRSGGSKWDGENRELRISKYTGRQWGPR